MRVEELQIGNWVITTYSKFPHQVLEIHDDGIMIDMYHHIGSIKPIPLTTDILEKNGFPTNEVTDGKAYAITGHLFVKDGICGTIALCCDGGCVITPLFECQYVHQLQNILNISGIKKEIVL